MRQILKDILCALVLAPFAAGTLYALLSEDPVQAEIGRRAAEEARFYDGERQRECAADILRPYYANGEPTEEQVEAAYRDCE